MYKKSLISIVLTLMVLSLCSSAFAECSETATLNEIIQTLPQRFDGDTSISTTIRFRFKQDDKTFLQYTAIVQNGVCTVQEGTTATPQLMISCPANIYKEIELGRMTPLQAIESGYMQISDRTLARQFLQHFIFYYQLCGMTPTPTGWADLPDLD